MKFRATETISEGIQNTTNPGDTHKWRDLKKRQPKGIVWTTSQAGKAREDIEIRS